MTGVQGQQQPWTGVNREKGGVSGGGEGPQSFLVLAILKPLRRITAHWDPVKLPVRGNGGKK